ncbi:putative thioesterase involved in non-ribosomal peptide biosynthesis [Shewanella psychrophila]|uniref:Putative thioesterase involved in non-ribosomal peptide biosynthesis n=1 Tax=Shewanella psychrophila TaxID=225848 RepID=A0A1S6HN54_9GAMM|nr:thioesterase domain-containing protein [Shewanella psychrophila]AQS36932.1 putative thioesterase involved in non-ribosomal peptide biosynthesis [Shewanella psychrophila]
MEQVFKTLHKSSNRPEHIWVIFPFAGGSLSAFKSWTSLGDGLLPNNTLILLATYPGRDNRMRERPHQHISDLADNLFDALINLISHSDLLANATLRLCGHSMGAQVAFEVCKQLEEHYGCATPITQLVLSGCHAPHLKSRRTLSHLHNDDFIDQLIEIGSGSAVLKQHPELLPVFLPMLRADFLATENYYSALENAPELEYTPCTLVFGESDPEAWSSEVQEWHEWFNPALRTHARVVGIPGDHFYITTSPATFIQHVIEQTESTTLVRSTPKQANSANPARSGEQHG